MSTATEKEIREKLQYSPELGGSCLSWKKSKFPKKVGAMAGAIKSDGYWRIVVGGKTLLAHRIVWFLHHNRFPMADLDHVDNNKLNNRIENLREATRSQNNMNTSPTKRNTSGAKNVSFHKRQKKWEVRVQVNRKMINFGYCDDLELAELVAIEAREKYHGNYARHT
jgi:hypothetical protein